MEATAKRREDITDSLSLRDLRTESTTGLIGCFQKLGMLSTTNFITINLEKLEILIWSREICKK
jgi:hypothetical protein